MQNDEHRPGVAAGAVGSLIADGAGGGAEGAAVSEGTKLVRGFMRSGVVQSATR